jgi:hypothetical protein
MPTRITMTTGQALDVVEDFDVVQGAIERGWVHLVAIHGDQRLNAFVNGEHVQYVEEIGGTQGTGGPEVQ